MNANPFPFSNDNKRYHTLSYHYKQVFGGRVQKAVIECGFTCPNIDGFKGFGGCIFCDGGSGYFTNAGLSVTEQLHLESERITTKFGSVPIIAYFQANTNTYTTASHMNNLIDEALSFPNIAGISIGTRADCLPDDIISLLREVNDRTYLTVELGMQSAHDKTISMINRCCTHQEFIEGYNKLKNAGIRVCLHLINGLPGETPEMMIESAEEAASLSPAGIKLQMLHVIKGTKLEEMYSAEQFRLLTKDEYVDIIVRQLEILPPETVIERITGDGDRKKLLAPLWSADKKSVISSIDKKLAALNTWQGKKFHPAP